MGATAGVARHDGGTSVDRREFIKKAGIIGIGLPVLAACQPITRVDFGGLVVGTTYTYRLSATSGSWRSNPASVGYTPAAC